MSLSYKKIAALASTIAALSLAIIGLLLIIIGNAFQYDLLKIDIDVLISNVGALLLVIGVLQWLFDTQVRRHFFSEVRSEIITSKRVSESGICDFFANSKDVEFEEYFLTSAELIIGVNYSPKLIDNSIELLEKRTQQGHKTTIISVKPDSPAGRFIKEDYNKQNLDESITKIKEIVQSLDPQGKLITIAQTNTILRYSFVLFDSRIWVVVNTNFGGRRAVPGFFVKVGSPWFEHYKTDIHSLMKAAV